MTTTNKARKREPRLAEMLVDRTDFEEHIAVGLGTLAYATLKVFEPKSINGKKLLKLVWRLPQKQYEVIILRFGLDGETRKTLKEIGNRWGVSRQRIQQLEKEALEKFRFRTSLMEFYIPCHEGIKEQYPDIDDIGLSTRTCRTLKKAGFENLKDFQDISRDDLMKIEFIGVKRATEVFEKLKEFNIPIQETDLDIDEVKFSKVIRNILRRAGFKKLTDLQNTSLEDLMKLEFMGYKRAVEVLEKLKEHNIPVKETSYTRIENVGFSDITLKILKRAGYRYLEELQHLPFQRLRNIKGIGLDGAKEVQAKLKELDNLFQEEVIAKGSLWYIPIEDVGFSKRTCNSLKRAGYTNLEELKNLTPKELKGIKYIGQKSCEEILEKLAVL